MQEQILKAVAVPVRILWAPAVPAILNFGLQVPFLLMWLSLHKNPLLFLITIPIGHLIILAYSAKEPHLSNMIKANRYFFTKSHSIYSSKGNKLAP